MLDVWMSHGDKVAALPPGFRLIGFDRVVPDRGDGRRGARLLRAAVPPRGHAHPAGRRDPRPLRARDLRLRRGLEHADYVAEAVARVREQVGDEDVILGLSGGVDSSVAAALIHRAIGDQLTCVFVDHGLLRQNEAEQVMDTFAEHLRVRVIHVDAAAEFLGALAGVADPEQKRKIIGQAVRRCVSARGGETSPTRSWLAQGTIYPDVIESAGAKTKKAHTIKSHHNVGGLPETLHLKLLEPLRELFKDEVRELGLELGLPRAMVFRHPFPGPGLGVRILGAVTREHADLLRRADAIFIDELRLARDRRRLLVRQGRAGVRGVPADPIGRRDGRRPHLRVCRGAARGADHRLHDRGLGAAAARPARAVSATGSSTRCAASTASSTTSRPSRRRRSSGSRWPSRSIRFYPHSLLNPTALPIAAIRDRPVIRRILTQLATGAALPMDRLRRVFDCGSTSPLRSPAG